MRPLCRKQFWQLPFSFCVVLICQPQPLLCSLLKLHDSRSILEDKNGKVAFSTVLSTNESFFPANLEPTCLILSGLVVPYEKGMTFHYRIQEESLILGSVVRMVQRNCWDTSRLATWYPPRLSFRMKSSGWRHGSEVKNVCYSFRGLQFGSHTHQVAHNCL